MNKKVMEIAKKAGFVFWQDEDYGPGPGNIDWASDYTEEFNKFIKLLIDESLLAVEDGTKQGAEYQKKIKKHFKVK